MISVFTITVTMPQPGPPLLSVCSALGFIRPHFHLIRYSNEHPNTKILVHTLTSALGDTEFPQIIPYPNQRRKTVIHARTIDLGYHIFLFLLKLSPESSNPLRRICMYNSLASDGYNEKTIDLLDTDPHCQIVIATKAMSVGIHAEKLQDSISVGTSETQDCGKQEGGRAGQNLDELARQIIFTTLKELNEVQNIIKVSGEVSVAAVACVKLPSKLKSKKKTTPSLNPAKICKDLTELPPYTNKTTLPPFILPSTPAKQQTGKKKADELKKSEVIEVRKSLAMYEERLYFEERLLVGLHRNRPLSSYFPKVIRDWITVELPKIQSRADLNVILASLEWPFIETQGSNLFDLICSLKKDIYSRQRTKSLKQY
ncbi:hypothetical protein BDP27DRAFT_1434455 [Rhodocollybia butyracea]|uniref:Helicase C-terminal domain-containing protein n=1 Tax=Rhodocollybia butyracea TaxID=206335 RepID=A0A9P5P797_9AGAR|nr:hypothetical protein BDP27DRAFT_1434455 [Rhodocollybia butyracea]